MRGPGLRQTLWIVATANFVYFFLESGAALRFDSVALLADSIDFLEDAAVNLLVIVGLGWPSSRRRALGRVLALLLLVPGVMTLWTVIDRLADPVLPNATALGVVGLGALAVNTSCAWLLVRHRQAAGSLTRAAFLSARNDAVANGAIIAAGFATGATLSHWPDLVVGVGILLINLDSAREVWKLAHGAAEPENIQI